MTEQSRGWVWVLGGTALGFVLTVVLLFSLIGGYLAAGIVAFGVTVLLVGLGIASLVRGAQAVVWLGQAARRGIAVVRPQPYPVAEVRVGATLVEMEGSCASRVQYTVGDEFTFEGGRRVTPAMCGPALHGLRPYVERLLTAEDGQAVRIQCPLSGSVLVFELHRKEVPAPGADDGNLRVAA